MPAVCSYVTLSTGELDFNAAAKKSAGVTRRSHWWIRAPKGGRRGAGGVLDVTAGQFSFAFPYENGRNTGFMLPEGAASKRARIVIDRVKEKLGKKALKNFRAACIRRFQKAQGQRGARPC